MSADNVRAELVEQKMQHHSASSAGSVAEWLACWTQARKGLGSNRSRDAVG